MTCEQIWEWSASEDDALHERAEQHFAGCAHCRAMRENLEFFLARLAQHQPLAARQRRLWLNAMEWATVRAQPMVGNSVWSALRNRQASRPAAIAAVCTAAAMTLFAVAMHSTAKKPGSPGMKELPGAVASTQSPVTVIPLTWTLCFGHIEQDLDAADARLQQVSEALSLIELQRDIEHTLEQNRGWND